MNKQNFSGLILLSIFLLTGIEVNAQFNLPTDHPRKVKFQISAFGVISSYYNDYRVTNNTHSAMGVGAGFKAEIPLVKGIKFLPGAEILTQGVRFDSYYFYPGYSQIYDGNFKFNHSIRTTEIGLPLLFKINMLLKEEVLPNNFFYVVGWEPKYNLKAHTTITKIDDGSLLYDNDIDLQYENHFLGSVDIGNYVVGGIGFNHNFLPGYRSVVFDFTYRYGLSRYVYTGNKNTNRLLFRDTNFSIGIGIRF